MIAARCTIESPVGPLTITAEDDAVTAVDFGAGGGPGPNAGLLAEAARQLTEYFAGDLRDFTLPLAPSGTSFRLKVWAAMRAIPYGETRSYGDLARALDSAPRAVGGACGSNPIPLIIPCHRVVGAGGALGGFSGGAGCDTKRQLLALEGALPPQLPV
ncbi:MAG: methylated-DNA--[protein]-cysteine S-methyltransferase [Rhodospirillales bacterium]|nr:methylated-DNA--[protein]-cysteine S-methyltransferase [Rhodospirillales bacterium]